jgi:macrolide transport system ATP-binding/permease protein
VTLRQLYARLRSAWNWTRKESELDEEIAFHLSEEADERAAAGLTADQARVAANRDFGNASLIREVTREMWGWGFAERLIQDVRYGLRTMRRNPGFSLAVILSLALGIGANTAVFSLMDAVMLRMLPVSDPHRLVVFAHRGDGEASTGSNYPIYETLRTRSRSFQGVLAFWPLPMKLRLGSVTSSIEGQYVTLNYFSVLGVQPVLGRVLSEADTGDDVVVISHGLWERSFGGSPDVIGKAVIVNGVPLTIIGVHPPEFFGVQPGASVDVSVPLELQRRMAPEFGDRLAERGGTWGLCIIARLRNGISSESARAEAEVLVKPWVQEVVLPESGRLGSWARIELLEASAGLDTLRRKFSRPLRLLMAVVALVLLIACANIANLLLARSACRRREFAVRASIGAGRFRLVRQLLTESIVLATLGGIAGLFLATWAARLLVAFLSTGGRQLVLDVSPDLRVLSFTAAMTLVTAIVFGLAPALRATNLDLNASFKEHSAGRGSDTRGGRLRRLLVAGQVGVSLLLLIGASLFLRSLINIRGVDPGFNPEQLLIVSFDRLGTGYRGEHLTAFYRQALERIAGIPGVRAASLSSLGPLSGDDSTRFFNTPDYTAGSTDEHVVRVNSISPRYFETMGIPPLEGRQFSDRDGPGSARVAILSRSAARHYFAGRRAVGAIFRLGRTSLGPAIEIIGVVGDIKQKDLRDEPPRMVYFPLAQAPQPDLVAEVRTAGDIPATIVALRQTISAVNSEIPVESIKTVAERVNDGLVQERLVATLSSVFGLLALSLATLGLYGVVSYAVTMRTNEIGIRMALGANRLAVVRMIFCEAGIVVGAGVAFGLLGAVGLTRILANMLFGLTPTDALAYMLATVTLVGVAAIAAFIPARRAAMIDPIVALREQ